MKADTRFTSLLKDFDARQINKSSDVIFFMDDRFILRAFNSAWEVFAKENNGEDAMLKYGLGSSVIDVLPEPLKGYYSELYRKTLLLGKRIDSEYECSSDKIYRKFLQSLYPLRNGAGILVSNHLEVVKPHEESGEEFASKHQSNQGVITQCCHCRRIKDQTQKEKWDWIPDFVRNMPANTSHGFCNRCYEFYYPEFPNLLEKAG